MVFHLHEIHIIYYVFEFFQNLLASPNNVRPNTKNFTCRNFQTEQLNGSWFLTSHFVRQRCNSGVSVGFFFKSSPDLTASYNVKKKIDFCNLFKKKSKNRLQQFHFTLHLKFPHSLRNYICYEQNETSDAKIRWVVRPESYDKRRKILCREKHFKDKTLNITSLIYFQ